MTDTLITCDIPLDAPGRHSGHLRVPHSTHRSAYGWLGVPITVLANGGGPTTLLTAGVHGDEYEGQIAVDEIARDLPLEDLQGRLILLPKTNTPAADAGLRTSPIDGGNLNRAFPGEPRGTLTEMIAHYIEEALLPICNTLIDLHSGGSSLLYAPTLLRGPGFTPDEARVLKSLQNAFDLPYAWVFTGGGGPHSTARTAMGAANRKGVVPIMAELGGGGRVDVDVLALTRRGLRRCLHTLKHLPHETPDAARGTRAVHAQGSVFALSPGVFEPLMKIGDPVETGQTVAMIHSLGALLRPPVPVTSPYDGFVLCERAMAPVQVGDALYQIARDADI